MFASEVNVLSHNKTLVSGLQGLQQPTSFSYLNNISFKVIMN